MKVTARVLWICVSVTLGLSALAMGAVLLAGPAAHGQKAELVVETGHTNWVDSVAFSPDGKTLASGSWDQDIKLWDMATGQELRTLSGHTAEVKSVAFSPDGKMLASGSEDKTVRLWDVNTGHELRTLAGHAGGVNSVAFSPNGQILASGSWDHDVKLWDVATGHELRTLTGHTLGVSSVAFSPNGQTLASGSGDSNIKLWNAATGHELRTLTDHTLGVSSVAFSSNGQTLASGSWDHTVKVWDVASGRELHTLAGHADRVNSVAFSPDGQTLASGSWDKTIRLWDVATGHELRTLAGNAGVVLSVAFSPDGRQLASADSGHTIKLWDLATGRELRTLAGHARKILSAAVSHDGRTLASGRVDNAIELWDAATGREPRTLTGHAGAVWSVAFSPDGQTLASGSWDKTIRLWDVATGRELQTMTGHTAGVAFVAFSPDGKTLASGSEDKTVRLWEVATGRELRTLKGHTRTISSVAFSPDGRTLASGSWDKSIRLWDVATGRELRTFEGHTGEIWSVAFSPDGCMLASGSWEIKLWDVATGQALRTLQSHTDLISSVAFSPDGRWLVSGSWDHTVKLWDVPTGRELRTLAGHTSRVDFITFGPEGRLVFSSADDGSVRIWNAASGDQLAALYSLDQDEWVIVDPAGRFDTNNLDGGAPLHWIVDDDLMHPLPLEVFMHNYYTPRLLARIMNSEEPPHIRSIAEITNRVQPDVSIVSVTASKTHPGRADVVVHAASHTNEKGQASGLQNLHLFRNGQLVANTTLDQPLKSGDFTFSDIQLPTSAKQVTFTAYAFNHDDQQSEQIKSATPPPQIKSATTPTFDFSYEPGPPAKPRAYLLQIGVNHYPGRSGCTQLQGSVNDAEKLSEILTDRLTKRGLEVKPVLLISTDSENSAAKDNIHKALQAIAAVATPDDVFFLSFSGHGFDGNDGQFYIFPADIQGSCPRQDGEAPPHNAISADELAEWLRPIDAGEMTFILDSCHSASSVEANDFKPGPMGSRGLGQLAYDKRMRILAASQSDQEAHESEILHQGLLSYALTKTGLVEGRADWNPKDGKITVGEWLGYAADAVPKSREEGVVHTARGAMPIGRPTLTLKSAQIPAVFNFSKKDTFVLQ